eukprot:1182998-Prorocentrum_minimum.AAC.3
MEYVDAREPQNPTKSEEYQRHPQGVLYSRQKGMGGNVRRKKGTPVGVVYRAHSPSYWAAERTGLPRPTQRGVHRMIRGDVLGPQL